MAINYSFLECLTVADMAEVTAVVVDMVVAVTVAGVAVVIDVAALVIMAAEVTTPVPSIWPRFLELKKTSKLKTYFYFLTSLIF